MRTPIILFALTALGLATLASCGSDTHPAFAPEPTGGPKVFPDATSTSDARRDGGEGGMADGTSDGAMTDSTATDTSVADTATAG